MLANVSSAALMGIDAYRITLETDLSRSGLPAFTLVGLPDGAVREAKERVFTALKNSGFKLPPARITVNLAPADVRKEGSTFDLPLAIGLLAAAEYIEPTCLSEWYLAGELSLTGELRPVKGVLPLAIRARQEGAAGLIVPKANAREAAVADGLPVYGADHLGEVIRMLTGEEPLTPVEVDLESIFGHRTQHATDFSEVKGQEHAKRAIEIAAAGAHNLLLL